MSDLSLALAKIFPLTFAQLSEFEAEKLSREFFRDWSLQELHFFPMLVKARKMSSEIIEVADYEFSISALREQSFSPQRLNLSFSLNPSLRFLKISNSAPLLKKAPGLYALWKVQDEVHESILNEEQARVLDRLREDQVLLRSELTENENQVLTELISRNLVIAQSS